MTQNIDDILAHIIDSLEPLDIADRLNLSIEDLIDELDITTEQLIEAFKFKVERNLQVFSDVY